MFFFSSLASDCCSEGELLRGFNSLEWLGVGICSLLTIQILWDIDHSLCSTEMVAWARIQVMAGFCRRSLRLGSLLARHSQVPESSSVRRVIPSTLTPLVPQAVLIDTRRLRAPSHSCLKESARLTSAYHHWISGVG